MLCPTHKIVTDWGTCPECPTVCNACPVCGILTLTAADDFPTVCEGCQDRARESQGEAMRLFAPAPSQIPGQLGFGS